MSQFGLPLFVLLGIAVACCVLWLIAEIRGREPRPAQVGPSWAQLHKAQLIRVGVATAVGLVVFVVTGWIAAAVGLGCVTAMAPYLFGGARQDRKRIADLEALAEWTEALRDAASRSALPAAILSTAQSAPSRLQPALDVLTTVMKNREPLPDALRLVAQEMPDPVAHEVIGGLIAATYARGTQLQTTLTALAATAREMVRVRHQVEANRRPVRMSMVACVMMSVTMFAGLRVFQPKLVAPLSTPTGQVVLCFAVVLEAMGVWMMWQLSQFREPELFIGPPAARAAA